MSDTDTATAPKLRHGIAEEIRVLLARRRISATQLAKDLGWSQPYISRRMVGDQPFDADDMEAIAAVLKVDIVDLLPRSAKGNQGNVTVGFRGASVTPTAPVVPRSRTGDQPVLPDHPLLEHRLPMPGGWSRKTAPTGRL